MKLQLPRSGLIRASLLAMLGGLFITPAYTQSYPLWLFSGPGPYDFLGARVAGAGDLNGDGFADILVSAHGASPGGLLYAGEVRVYSGADGAVLLTLSGQAPSEGFGTSVEPAPDFDGDGIPELLVGAQFASPGGVAAAGSVRLFSGATGSLLLSFNGTDLVGMLSPSVVLGDVTGDGIADIVACAPGADVFGLTDNGRMTVFSGADATPWYDVVGSASGEGFSSVARVGDLDGDTLPDFAAGAPGAAFGGIPQAGLVTVFSGQTGSPIASSGGTIANELFGFSVAGIGDVDGDGAGDVAVGRPGAGLVDLVSGASLTLWISIPGPPPVSYLGSSVGATGDVDFDGVPDLIAGGLATPFGGMPNSGFAGVYSGATGLLLASTGGFAPNQNLGTSASGVGDVNGDGAPDFAAGAPNASVVGIQRGGYVRVFSAAGIPLGSAPFGLGCPGTGGAIPGITTMGGPPSTTNGNQGFRIVLTHALGGSPALLVAGVSPVFPPLDLGFLGSPGCPLSVLPAVALPAVTVGPIPGAGGATVTLPVPSSPALAGAVVFFQWYVVDPGPAIAPGVVSQPLGVVLQ